jgi:hypothetical protein
VKDLTEEMLQNAQLPDEVLSKTGKVLYQRPKDWK